MAGSFYVRVVGLNSQARIDQLSDGMIAVKLRPIPRTVPYGNSERGRTVVDASTASEERKLSATHQACPKGLRLVSD